MKHNHIWVEYIGLQEVFDHCKDCGMKKKDYVEETFATEVKDDAHYLDSLTYATLPFSFNLDPHLFPTPNGITKP